MLREPLADLESRRSVGLVVELESDPRLERLEALGQPSRVFTSFPETGSEVFGAGRGGRSPTHSQKSASLATVTQYLPRRTPRPFGLAEKLPCGQKESAILR